MSSPHPKLIDLDFGSAEAEVRLAGAPIIPMPGQNPSAEGNATGEKRDPMDQLQQTAWEARARLRSVEEERDSLAARFAEAQRAIDDLRARIAEGGSDNSSFAQEREALQKEVQRNARAATDREQRAMNAERQTIDLQKRCDDIARQRDDLNRVVAQLQRASQKGGPSPEAESQLLNLRLARDTAWATNRELQEKLTHAEDEIALLTDQLEVSTAAAATSSSAENTPLDSDGLTARIAELEAELNTARTQQHDASSETADAAAWTQQRDEVLVQLEILTKEVLGLRGQLQERTAEVETLRATLTEAGRRHADLDASVAPLRADAMAARATRDEALTSLNAAQKQIDRIRQDRDGIREEATRHKLALEKTVEITTSQLSDQQGAVSDLEAAKREIARLRESIERGDVEKVELARRTEVQRLQTIDLGTRLEHEQHEVRALSARLAEARLLVKAAGGRLEDPVESRVAAPLSLPSALPPPPSQSTDPFDAANALEMIRAMRRCYHAFSKSPDDVSHLNELHCQIHSLSEHAGEARFSALQRLLAAFDGFIQELYHFPEQINSTTINTIPQTIEFLASLMKLKDPRALRDASEATVYVVEDDPLTCECITMAMETSMMRGLCSQDPARAAYELAGTPCELILLDINMPGMDGFELCAEIRNLALHRDTPVMFLSGMATQEMRSRAALVGGCDFLAKPFILCELTLKVLVHMAKAQLRIV